MQTAPRPSLSCGLFTLLVAAILSLAGCGVGGGKTIAPGAASGASLRVSGVVHGGQQPIAGSTISLYAAGKSGVASAPRSMLTSPVMTTAGGNFTIDGLYTCNAGDQVYITATGGDAGSGTGPNSAIALMAALGPCATLQANAATTFIDINEVTTVGSVYALAGFMQGVQALGSDQTTSSTTGANALAAAFANTGTMVNTQNGAALTTALGNGQVPQQTINSLANSLAACVNSTTTDTTCSKLFSAATTSSNTPTDTLQAALNLAHNPALNTADIWKLATPEAPFLPALSNAPASYAINVTWPGDVLTYHNDAQRSGAQPFETTLTTANVNSTHFGKKFTFPVDGQLYAAPLFVGGYGMPDGQLHDLVIAATAHGSVYVFDADGKNPTSGYLWMESMFAPGEASVLQSDYQGCGDTSPESSLLGTPVIDRSTGTLYVVSTQKITASGAFTQKLHALSLLDGTEKFGGPTLITATYAGSGAGATNNVLTFDPLKQNQRPALLLANGAVWITWASHCDQGPYHGYVMAYSAANVTQRMVLFNNTPNGSDGGIWMGGGGPSADASGSVYVVGGNGTYDSFSGGPDYGDSSLKLGMPASGSTMPTVADYFTPYNQSALSSADQDVGTSDFLIFNDPSPSATYAQHLAIQTDKTGKLYVINTDKMGGYDYTTNMDVNYDVQDFTPGGQFFTNLAFFNGTLYLGTNGKPLEAFAFQSGSSSAAGKFNTTPTSMSPTTASGNYGNGGWAPSISANGTANAIVWVQDHTGSPGLLRAYDASNLATELYDSGQASGSRDALPSTAVKFTSPTVANGQVFVGTNAALMVYGLLP